MQRRKQNYKKLLCKDVYSWVCDSKTTLPDEWVETQIEKCKFRVRADGFRNNAFVYGLQQYKSVKINYVHYSVSLSAVTYNVQVVNAKPENGFKSGYGVTGLHRIPFFILWNYNADIPKNPSQNVIQDSSHSKLLFVGGRPAKFMYKVPKNKRSYVDCTYLYKHADPKEAGYNNLCKYLSLFDMCPHGPEFFYLTCGSELSSIQKSIVPEGLIDMPFKFIVKIETKIGCTFKGYNDVVYSFNSPTLYAATGGARTSDDM